MYFHTVATTKKGNIPFEAADLASVILAALTLSWQNQYNLTHSTVPKSPRVLTPELENIERVMKERDGDKHKSKDKAAVASPTKGKSNKGSPKGGSFKTAPKKAKTEKYLEEYAPDIVYIKGVHNTVADAISRLEYNPALNPTNEYTHANVRVPTGEPSTDPSKWKAVAKHWRCCNKCYATTNTSTSS